MSAGGFQEADNIYFFVNFYYFSLNQTMSRHDLLFLIYQSAQKGVNGNKHPIHTNTKVLWLYFISTCNLFNVEEFWLTRYDNLLPL